METRKRLQRFLSIFLACIMILNVPMSAMAFEDVLILDEAEMAVMEDEVTLSDETVVEDEVPTDGFLSENEEVISEDLSEEPPHEEEISLFGEETDEESLEVVSIEEVALDSAMELAVEEAMEGTDGTAEAATEGYVYLSVSNDGRYIAGKSGSPMACVAVPLSELEKIDLNNYGLADYVYDANGDEVNDITALYLFIYAHEQIYGGNWADVEFTGEPGSGYFSSGLFGFANNLNYYYNGSYAIDDALTETNGYATGATSEHIVLSAGDYVDVAGFSNESMQIYSATFRYFTDANGKAVRGYNAAAGEELTVRMCAAGQDWTDGSTKYEKCEGTVYYGQTAFASDAASVETVDGQASVTFDAAGTWYIWSEGYNDGTVSCSPAYAVVTVEAAEHTVYKVTLPEGDGYTVTGETTVTAGTDYTFCVNVSEGYDDSNMVVAVNEETVTGTDGSYTVEKVNSDLNITVAGVVEAKEEIEGGIYIGAVTSNGSLDSVMFKDTDGNTIDGIECSIDGTAITVVLPKTYSVNGNVTATFSRTANGDDLPFVTPKNAFNRAYSSRTDTYTTTLSSGAGKAEIYFYNSKPKAINNSYTTYTLNYSVKNELPVLAEGQASADSVTITAGDSFEADLSSVFTDADGDTLTHYVSVNGAAKTKIDDPTSYVYTTNDAGMYSLVFTANDGKGDSAETFTVTLTVENSKETRFMSIYVPKDVSPEFYAGTDAAGDKLEAVTADQSEEEVILAAADVSEEMVSENGENSDFDGNSGETGETGSSEKSEELSVYTVQYPINAEYIFVNTIDWGGTVVKTDENGSAVLRKVTVEITDLAGKMVEADLTVTGAGNSAAVASENGYLLAVGTEYTYTAAPKDTSAYTVATETAVLESGIDVWKVTLKLEYKSPKTITVPTGATAQMFAYNKYYDFTEIEAAAVVDNEDETTTFYFVTSKSPLSWRASREGYVTEAGYWTKNLTVDFDNGKNSSAANAAIEDNSVLVNVNRQNNLVLSPGSSYKLKGYRAWEIIKYSYQNEILTPDFNFNILSGADKVSLTPAESRSNGGSGADSDWVTVTAEKSGTAIIEVSYDALDVSAGSWPGLYKASDASRTGLVVVQVGGNDSSVDFGIDCYSGMGSTTYSESNAKKWDAEFDTLYFIGNSGSLKLSPTASSAVAEVAVSHNKGNSWTALSNENGVYTAPIVSGNNIIRVTTETGTAYQVVRGDQVTYTATVINGNDNGLVDEGETVRVTLYGLHTPIPKMAGNYNPGFMGNTDGASGTHVSYTVNGETVKGAMTQYDFATAANYIDVTIPEDYSGSSISLTDGYIGVGVIGLTAFADGGDSHRNIPDAGCSTRGSTTTFNTRSILPEISIIIGEAASPNTAPIVVSDAVTNATVNLGNNYAINPETLFADAEGDELTFVVSVNGGEKASAAVDYKFTPDAVGEYSLVFTASDGEYEVSHTITLTVTKADDSGTENELEFDIDEKDIVGYVIVSVEDNGVRLEGEKGLTYPVPLGSIVQSTAVPYAEGDTIADVTLRLLDAKKIGYTYTGTLKANFYLASIKNFVVDGTSYEEMGEFDAGVGSGWMITLNDWFIDKGASEFEVQNGDVIEWKYTCQYGSDIGDTYTEEAIDEVSAAVTAIPPTESLTLADKEKVEAARAAYEALTDSQKALVADEIVRVLEAAEAKIAELQKAEEEVQKPHVHSWDAGTVTKPATCKETGVKTFKCSCGQTKTETIAKSTAHKYGSWTTVSEATVKAAEVQKHTCTICGKEETQTVGEALTPILEVPGKLKSFNIKKGRTAKFTVTMANGDSVSSVKSSKTKYLKASVDKKTGKITLKGVKKGTSKLTIKLVSGKKRTYTIKVVTGTVKTSSVSVTSVKNKKLTLAVKKTHTLKSERKPFTSTQKLTYKSSNKKVATVSSKGKIKAVAPGKAAITVSSGSRKVKITVTVPGITNVKSSVSVKRNKTLTLKPKTYGISEKVTYTSSNTKIATVTSKGKIKGIRKGTAKITIKAGTFKKTVKVKIK